MQQKCSYEPLSDISEVRLLQETAGLKMKKSCSCEPVGVLCLLDPMTDYDWGNRAEGSKCSLSDSQQAWIQWKVL